MAKQVNCDCGFMVRTQTDEEIVRHVQLHAKEIHQMEVPREKALMESSNLSVSLALQGRSGFRTRSLSSTPNIGEDDQSQTQE